MGKTWTVENEKKAVELIFQIFANEKESPVIIPWSDSAAAEIDRNYDALSHSFIVPSLNQKEGAIIEMMDKKNQIFFFKETWSTYGKIIYNRIAIQGQDRRIADSVYL